MNKQFHIGCGFGRIRNPSSYKTNDSRSIVNNQKLLLLQNQKNRYLMEYNLLRKALSETSSNNKINQKIRNRILLNLSIFKKQIIEISKEINRLSINNRKRKKF